jgi:hypothetical protein
MNVQLAGGVGTGAEATIVVSGGAVTSVTLTNNGINYSPIDVLTTATANIGGGAGSGLKVPVASVSSSSGFSIPVATATAVFATALQQGTNGAVSLEAVGAAPMSFGVNRASAITISAANAIQFNTYGAGTLSTNSSGVITASDGRLKKKTRVVVSGLETIRKLTPLYFRWNDDSPFFGEHEEIGFIAQEVAAIIPEASPEPALKDQFRNYHDRAIIAFLVKGMQELSDRYDALEEKYEALSAHR